MQAENAKEIAQINANNALNIAQIQSDTQLKSAGLHTADGQLPRQQTLESASRVLLQKAQQWSAEATADKTQVETSAVRQKMQIDAIASFLAASPTEIIDLGLIKYTHKPGWKSVLSVLTKAGNDETRQQDLAAALSAVPDDQFSGMKRDIIELAAIGAKGAQGVARGGKYLSGLFSPKHKGNPSGGKRKFTDTSGKTHWLDN